MPRFFVFTAIVVTFCAVATIVAASGRTAGPRAVHIVALR